jgi:hypothetical protein
LFRHEQAFINNLRDIKIIFDGAGIRFWLDFGTLLGAVREGKVLTWDDDIDLGALSDSWDSIIRVIQQLQDKGFYAASTEIQMHGDTYFRVIWLRRHNVNVDLIIYQIVDQKAIGFDTADDRGATKRLIRGFRWGHLLLNGAVHFTLHPTGTEHVLLDYVFRVAEQTLTLIPQHQRSRLANLVWKMGRATGIKIARFVIPRHFFEDLGTITIYGLKFNAPSDVEEYLALHYRDWRIPSKEWDWTRDDGTISGYF